LSLKKTHIQIDGARSEGAMVYGKENHILRFIEILNSTHLIKTEPGTTNVEKYKKLVGKRGMKD
jgi:hypothetical protein